MGLKEQFASDHAMHSTSMGWLDTGVLVVFVSPVVSLFLIGFICDIFVADGVGINNGYCVQLWSYIYEMENMTYNRCKNCYCV